MKATTSLLLVVLVGCAGEDSSPSGGTNPPTLWFAEGSGGTMKLVDAEPKSY